MSNKVNSSISGTVVVAVAVSIISASDSESDSMAAITKFGEMEVNKV